MKKILVIAILIFNSHYSMAQVENTQLKKHELDLLNILLADTINNTSLNLSNAFNFGVDNLLFTYSNVLKKGKDIYIQFLGTGRLYQVYKENGKVGVKRIDQTIHSGVNFFAQNFFIKDTLFQYGGLGFWQIRGLITYYSKITNQWELVQSNRSVQSYFDDQKESLMHYDDQRPDPKMYVSNSYYYPNYPNSFETSATDSCYEYDFQSRSWSALGKLTPDLKKAFGNKHSHDFEIHRKNLFYFQNQLEFYWMDFEKNKFGRLTPKENNRLRQVWLQFYNNDKSRQQIGFQFGMGNDIYFAKLDPEMNLKWTKTSFDFNAIDSTNAFEIYDNEKSITEMALGIFHEHKGILYFIFSIIIILIGIRSSVFQKKRIPKEVTSILYQNFFSALNIIEKELIEALCQSNLKGEEVSTKTINKIIGVQQKDTLTQNKSRSDHFIKINQKFKMATQNGEPLIIKNRDKDDKRQYNYGINGLYLDAVNKLFKD